MIALAQSYTTIPVEVITINSTTSLALQIKTFNQFDVLISPHGSHLANGIFVLKPASKVVIEVVSFAFDRVFYSNYNSHLGFGNYFLSTGHLTPAQVNSTGTGEHCVFQSQNAFKDKACQKVKHRYHPGMIEQEFLECPVQYHTRSCDTLVDLKGKLLVIYM